MLCAPAGIVPNLAGQGGSLGGGAGVEGTVAEHRAAGGRALARTITMLRRLRIVANAAAEARETALDESRSVPSRSMATSWILGFKYCFCNALRFRWPL
jgi:hypothetical protein